MVERSQRSGAIGSRLQGDARLGRESVGLCTLAGIRVRRQVVAGERTRELV